MSPDSGGAGHVRRLRRRGVGQLGRPGLRRAVEAHHVHVVAGGGRRVVGDEAAEVVDVAAVVPGGGAHRVAAHQQRAAAGVGVDVLEVVAGKREGRAGHHLIVRVERHDVDHARALLEEREPRAAARNRRDRQHRQTQRGAVVVDLVVGVGRADVDLGDAHPIRQRRRADAAVAARAVAAVWDGDAWSTAGARAAAGARATTCAGVAARPTGRAAAGAGAATRAVSTAGRAAASAILARRRGAAERQETESHCPDDRRGVSTDVHAIHLGSWKVPA